MMYIFEENTYCPSLGDFHNLAISTIFQETPYVCEEDDDETETEETPFPIIYSKEPQSSFSYHTETSKLFFPQIVQVDLI